MKEESWIHLVERGLALAEILTGEGVGIFKVVQREGARAHDEGQVWNMVYYYDTYRYFSPRTNIH